MSSQSWTRDFDPANPGRAVRHARRAMNQLDQVLPPPTGPAANNLDKLNMDELGEVGQALDQAQDALGTLSVAIASTARSRGASLAEAGRVLRTSASTIQKWERKLNTTSTEEDPANSNN